MPDDRLIVALDLPNAIAAGELVDQLGDAVGFYKIGLGIAHLIGDAVAALIRGAAPRHPLPAEFAPKRHLARPRAVP